MLIRLARPDDADGVWPLARALATSFTPERDRFESTWAELLGAPRALVVVAEGEGRRIVGYLLAHSHLAFFANGPLAWIEEVMVDERHRRSGVGKRLVARAEDWARSIDAAYVALASRRAGAFYLALGYEDSAVFYRKMLAGSQGEEAGTPR
ncbi:GNAT family N-acetyltransferase [Actinomycetes bacterium KLBMP 9759]